jgi:hypothetical protein
MRGVRALAAVAILSMSAGAVGAELPLRSGFYTLQDIPCDQASFANANVLHVMPGRFEIGKDICAITRIAPGSNALMLTMRCEDRSIGRKSTQSMPVRIFDREHFVYGRRPDARYRYCALESMSEEWRTMNELEPFYPAYEPG